MHTPWLQIANEVREVNAPQFAAELDVGVGDAYLMLSDFLGWALRRCPEDRPPSASSLIRGSSAGRQIANAMGWRGDVDRLVDALVRLPYAMVEMLPDGIRIRGLKRYDHYWTKSYPDAARLWKASGVVSQPSATPIGAETAPKPRRESAETAPPDPDPDPDPDLEKDLPTPKPPSADAPSPVVVVEKEIGDCWEKLQDNRARARLKRETHRPRAFAQWYRDKRRDGRSDAELADAHWQYLGSKTIRAVGHPTQVFLTEGICEARLPNPKAEELRRHLERLGRKKPPLLENVGPPETP